MPELPEVETIRRDLHRKILNKKITGIFLTAKAKTNKSRLEMEKFIKGKKFSDIDRIGKLLIFKFAGTDEVMLIHLKMTGQLIYQKGKKIIAGGHSKPDEDFKEIIEEKEKPPLHCPHTRATFVFSDDSFLYFNDMRRFGYIKIVDKKELDKIKKKYGPEPLTKNFTFEYFKDALKGRKTSLKALLLNQEVFAGIGNIYADESCFAAGIYPGRQADKLTEAEKKKLFQAINKVIKKAIETRGTSFNKYVDADGNKGNFTKYLKVYHRAGQKCKKCGKILKSKKIGGRTTVFCSSCQK